MPEAFGGISPLEDEQKCFTKSYFAFILPQNYGQESVCVCVYIYMAFSRQNNTISLVNLKVCFYHSYFSSDGLVERMPFTVSFPNVDF